jgi:hypothetical protein
MILIRLIVVILREQNGMNKSARKSICSYMESCSEQLSSKFTPVPKELWPTLGNAPLSVWENRYFLVQVYDAGDEYHRLSVTKRKLGYGRTFDDGIGWEDLMTIKAGICMGNRFAVEIYPEDANVVNVANMRHLWVFPAGQRLNFAWTEKNK